MPDPLDPAARADILRSARIGLILFLIYFLVYGGFLYLAAFHPAVMAMHPFGGLTLAVWYGMGLIVSPLVLALIYLAAVRRAPSP
jgi:uncharacterized membrane protein (DUF485 family)